MEVAIEPGKYVVAVSGGVDSIVLLDLLTEIKGINLVVAHFDHGIRLDSADDAAFVTGLAQYYDLPLALERVVLGPNASENVARDARYSFLKRAVKEHGAAAIITAHHQDDLLETAIFNILRGTGRRGLTALKSTADIQRPLLHVSKRQIIDEALKRKLSWWEDTSNYDERYSRNYIRRRLLVKFDNAARQQLLTHIEDLRELNSRIDEDLTALLGQQPSISELDRVWFKELPDGLAQEVMVSWLRRNHISDYDKPTIDRLVNQSRRLTTGKRIDVRGKIRIQVNRKLLALEVAER